MQMLGEQFITASCQRVWEALNDPQILRASIPGCQSLDKESDERFAATVEVKVGPIGARFKGVVTLTDLNPPHSYTLLLQGNGGIAGTAKGAAKVNLTEKDGGTLVAYDVDAEVGGRMAQLGGPVIDATAKHLAGKFFGQFGEIVSGVKAAAPAAARATAASGAAATVPARVPPSAPPRTSAIAWLVAIALGLVGGFILGKGAGLSDSAWAGVSIGLLLILVAAAAFEYGRRGAATIITLDAASLRRLLDGEK
jgi:carbon monoxide dehydrogenase subunit G